MVDVPPRLFEPVGRQLARVGARLVREAQLVHDVSAHELRVCVSQGGTDVRAGSQGAVDLQDLFEFHFRF